MKLCVLKVTTVGELVQFGVQPICHFFLFLPGKEGVISGAKLYNVRAVGLDLLPLPGAAEVPCGEKNSLSICIVTLVIWKYLVGALRGAKDQGLEFRTVLQFSVCKAWYHTDLQRLSKAQIKPGPGIHSRLQAGKEICLTSKGRWKISHLLFFFF